MVLTMILPIKKISVRSLKMPHYKEDFEHIFAQIGFAGFLKDLERLNQNLASPLNTAAIKWKKLIELKHAEWKADDICDAERRDRLTQALLSANENIEAYMDCEERGKGHFGTKMRRKRATRREKKKLREDGGTAMGTTLTQRSGEQKNFKNAKIKKKKVVVQKDSIASRLRSKVDAPELPPIEQDPLFRALSLHTGGQDVTMEL
ncbi:hypothetical protein ONS95_009252 [Cadophora gregata]|uniref:uncharacterized protein n=1 Tax=Cadophora gregata TaxID=51156 RepID=UPI0026DD259D|nr:uncharacterized protein ONS95_009252 [Cadophora gregata]KAK0124280.1 hypothetical protein ONS95_009252 [Cadophora gregata]